MTKLVEGVIIYQRDIKISVFSPECFKKEQFQDNRKTLWAKVKQFRIACNTGFAFRQHPLATFGLLFNICFELMMLLGIKACLFLPVEYTVSSYRIHWPSEKQSWDNLLCLFTKCYYNYYPQPYQQSCFWSSHDITMKAFKLWFQKMHFTRLQSRQDKCWLL